MEGTLELTSLFGSTVSGHFRTAVLSMLVFDGSRSWRVRRVDRFSGVDWDFFRQETSLDLQLDQRLLIEALRGLQEAYRDANRPAEGVSIARALTAVQAGTPGGVETASVVVPVAWVPGPLMGFDMSASGQPLVPLSRRRTADEMSLVVGFALREAAHDGVIPEPPGHLGPSHVVWRDIGWMLTATDLHSLRNAYAGDNAMWRENADHEADDLLRFMQSNVSRRGATASASKRLVNRRVDDILTLMQHSAAVRQTLVQRGARSSRRPIASSALSPAVNPLLLHRSFISLLDWLERQGNEHPVAGTRAGELLYFLGVCGYWLEVIGLLSDNLEDGPDATAVKLLHQLVVLGDNWPIMVELPLPVGAVRRVDFSQVIYAPTRRRSTSAAIGANWTPWRWVFNRAKSMPLGAWSWVSSTVDYLSIESGRRTLLMSQRNAQTYPLVLGDALSLHVEVLCERPELLLVPRSAFVKIPVIAYPSGLARWLLGSHRMTRSLLPRKKVTAARVFGRVTDDGQRIQHFYTTKTAAETRAILSKPGEVVADEGGQPSLVVRYRIERGVVWMNRTVVAVVMSVAVVMLWASLTAAASPDSTVIGPLVFDDALKLAVPTVLASLLLFAFEKHTDRAVAQTLRTYSLWVLTAGVLIAVAAAGFTLVEHPSVFGFVPASFVAAAAGMWIGVSVAVTENVDALWRIAASVIAVLAALAVVPLLLWGLLLLAGWATDKLGMDFGASEGDYGES